MPDNFAICSGYDYDAYFLDNNGSNDAAGTAGDVHEKSLPGGAILTRYFGAGPLSIDSKMINEIQRKFSHIASTFLTFCILTKALRNL